MQCEESKKGKLFEKLEKFAQPKIQQQNIFVICNFKLDPKKTPPFLRAMKINCPSIKNQVKIDFIIFTSKSRIILVKFESDNPLDEGKQLLSGENFLRELEPKSSEFRQSIQSVLVSKVVLQENKEGIRVISDLADVIKLLEGMQIGESEIAKPAFLHLLQSVVFLRTAKIMKKSGECMFWVRSETLADKINELEKIITMADFEETPVILIGPEVVLEQTQHILYNMTPRQYELLLSLETTHLIIGAAGTGKTLVTKFRLLKHVKQYSGERTVLFVPLNMIDEYRDFLNLNAREAGSCVWIFSLSNLTSFIELLKKELEKGSHIFIDDAQHFYELQRIFSCPEMVAALNEWQKIYGDKKILWILFDWLQFLQTAPFLNESLRFPKWLFPKAVRNLDLVMRNTLKIMKFVSAIQHKLLGVLKTANPTIGDTVLARAAIESQPTAESTSTALDGTEPSTKPKEKKEQKEESENKAALPLPGEEGQKIPGLGVTLICWNEAMKGTHEVSAVMEGAVKQGIKYLKDKCVDAKSAVICSGSVLHEESLKSNLTSKSKSFLGLPKYFNCETSSQEFPAVIFVLHVPADFESSPSTQLTLLSEIYQSITRAQLLLVIVVDAPSWTRLKNVVPHLEDFTDKLEVVIMLE